MPHARSDLLFEDTNLLFEDINKGKTCLTCRYRQRWEYGSKIIQYCGIIASNRTENGHLKIKCKNPACQLYEMDIWRRNPDYI
jgi:hypothetical protein